MRAESRSTLTVVLVNYRSLDNVAERLASDALQGHRIVVVDNGDDPAGVTAACDRYGAEAVLLDSNRGFAGGVNAAVASVGPTSTPWLLLNPDVEATSKDLAALVRQLGDADGAGPALRQADGRLQVGAGGGPLTLRAVVSYFLFLAHVFPWLRGIFLTRRQTRRSRDVNWLCMACLVLAPDAFERFGLIPEDELVYAEDVAWGTAASQKGARFRLCADVIVDHAHGSSGESARWVGALERLCHRRLGRSRGVLCVAAIRAGLGIRRLLGRRVV